MTIREKLNDSERIAREFTNHVECGFLPLVKNLSRLVRATKSAESGCHTTDVSIRDMASQVYASDRFTAQSYQKLLPYLESIHSELARLSNQHDETKTA
jgi:hypothetical protein